MAERSQKDREGVQGKEDGWPMSSMKAGNPTGSVQMAAGHAVGGKAKMTPGTPGRRWPSTQSSSGSMQSGRSRNNKGDYRRTRETEADFRLRTKEM